MDLFLWQSCTLDLSAKISYTEYNNLCGSVEHAFFEM